MTNEKTFDLSQDIQTLSDDQLEMVVGGRITDGDRERLARFVKQCKYEGASLDECIAYLRKVFPGKAAELYLDDYIAYVTEIW